MVATLLTALRALPLLAGTDRSAVAPAFRARSATRSGTIRLQGPVSQVFALFGPVLEKGWAPGWNPEIVYPIGPDVADGMVFTTRAERGDSTWIITHFDPARVEITYHVVAPGTLVTRIAIQCRPLSNKETEANVTYSYTALSDRGNTIVDEFTDSAMTARVVHWTEAINYLLRTGKTLAHH